MSQYSDPEVWNAERPMVGVCACGCVAPEHDAEGCRTHPLCVAYEEVERVEVFENPPASAVDEQRSA